MTRFLRRFRALVASRPDGLPRVFLVAGLSLPSLLLFARLPPLFKDVDGYVQLTYGLGVTTILHHPPGYCYGARIPMTLFALWQSLGDGPSFAMSAFFGDFMVTQGRAYALVITQHVITWFLLAEVIRQRVTSPLGQLASALVVLGLPYFFMSAHLLGNEAGATLSLLWLMVIIGKILDRPSTVRWAAYLAALMVAILTRHIYGMLPALLAGWLALRLLWMALANRRRRAPAGLSGLRAEARKLVLSIALGLLAVVLAGGIRWTFATAADISFRSRGGTTTLDRNWLKDVNDPAEKARILAALQAETDDELVHYIFQMMAEHGRYWGPPSRLVPEWAGVRFGLQGDARERRVDEAYAAAARIVLRVMPRPLQEKILLDARAAAATSVTSYTRFPLGAHRWMLEDRLKNPAGYRNLAPDIHLDLPVMHELERWADRSLFLSGPFGGVRLWHLLTAVGVLALLLRLMGSPKSSYAGWLAFAAAFGAVLTLASNLVIDYMDRYAQPAFVLAGVALVSMVGLIVDHLVRKKTPEPRGVPLIIPPGSPVPAAPRPQPHP